MANYRQQQKNNVEPVEPNKLVEPQNILPLSKCPNCQSLKEQLEVVATLPTAYINNLLAERDEKHRKDLESINKQIQEVEQLKAENKDLKKQIKKLKTCPN
ncbi:14257_t:CDS:1 [Funneliformis geosporum]|uniref:17830_t:CDS:1 n=1 Tax=Funneliformis geosporum TaxID=1117311 RepID=A0A9W4WPM7_9GLOM|nr:14257_t:CDS:1 [Funneliformis geosporum]CAI2162562.1 17830_t:CDS:1 [Funneliformis geosporum]